MTPIDNPYYRAQSPYVSLPPTPVQEDIRPPYHQYTSLLPCRQIALIQGGLLFFSITYLYLTWWSIILGLLLAMIGVWATREPVLSTQRKWILAYYYGNIFMLPVFATSTILLLIWASRLDWTGWVWFALGITGAFTVSIATVYCIACLRAKALVKEINAFPPESITCTFIEV